MKKAKLVKQSDEKKKEELKESYSVKNLLTIILIVLVIFVGFYFITTLVVKPTSTAKSNNTSEVDSSKISFSQLLNMSEDEYYVLATNKNEYNNNTNHLATYDRYINNYTSKDDSLKFYRIDLSDALNKSYIDDPTKISSELKGVKLSNEVLFKIKSGKIEKYYVGSESIINALKEL